MARAAVVTGDDVYRAVTPEAAIEHVRSAFLEHAAGRWQMPPKVYLQSPPHGDFRAMPASGDGLAIVKWVTSFPGNRRRGLPVVVGTILVSDGETGAWKALVDGTAVTALRTGASAAVAARALARAGAETAGVIGCGLHGRWAALCLRAEGFTDGVCADVDQEAARKLAAEMGWRTGSTGDALACDVVTTVTPGHEPVADAGDLNPGTHINALGADGPGKAELTLDAVLSCRLFCDDWGQASHGGELTGAVEAGRVTREDVTNIGDVLGGTAAGRRDDEEITLFDSTGLAIQDLAIVAAVMKALDAGTLEPREVEL